MLHPATGPNALLLESIYKAAVQPEHWAKLLQELSALSIQICLTATPLDRSEQLQERFRAQGLASKANFYASYQVTEVGETAHFLTWLSHLPPETVQRIVEKGLAHVGALGTAQANWRPYTSYQLSSQFYPQVFTGLLLSQPPKQLVFTLSLRLPWPLEQGSRQGCPVLKSLFPHLDRAHGLSQTLTHLHALQQSQMLALDAIPKALFGLTPQGQVLWANAEAEALLEELEMFRVRSGYLQAYRPEQHAALQEALARLMQPDRASHSGLLCFTGQHETVRVGRLVPGDEAQPLVLILNDPQGRQSTCASALQLLYHLTPAEIRVALLISEGLSPEQIADRVGCTLNTVRNQLKHVYMRTATNRQGELVRLVLNLS